MVNKFALDDAGRVMITAAPVTNAARRAAQAYLMDCACVDAGAVSATADSFNSGFRYTAAGALRVYDATAGLPASSSVNQGIAMTDDGQACYITSAIGADVAYLNGAAVDSSGRFYATLVDPVAWFRFNIGITETGQGVSTWADQTASANDLLQATDGARPPKQSDGSILFNGTDEYLECNAFTFNQPETVYFLGKQVTWTTNDSLWDGPVLNTLRVFTNTGTPIISANAGTTFGQTTELTLDTYHVLAVVYNGADPASLTQIDSNAAITGSSGAANAGGFRLGAQGGALGGYSHIQVKEIILFPVAHAANTRLHLISYLAHNGPVTL